jgi:hypothetical protein
MDAALLTLYEDALSSGWLTFNEAKFHAARRYAELNPDIEWTEAEDRLNELLKENHKQLSDLSG